MSFTPNRNMIRDKSGAIVDVTRYGQLVSAMRHDDVLCRFEYSNSTNDVTTTTTGTGAASNATSLAVASSGSGVGKCVFETNRYVVYRPAHEIFGYMSVIFSTGAANTTQRAGLFDGVDGFFFGYEGTSFGISIRTNSATTTTAQASWNKDKCDGTGASGFNLNPTKYNQYKISYGWLGIAPITFSIYGGESIGWVICHVIDKTNIQTTPTIYSPCSKIRWEAERTSGSGAITVSVGSVAGGTASGIHSHAGHRVFAATSGTKSISATTETALIGIRSESTFQSKNNKVLCEVMVVSASTDGTKNVRLVFYKTATITGGAWSSVDANNSVMSKNTTVASFSGGSQELILAMLKTDTLVFDSGVGHTHLEILPGENYLITAYSAGANDVEVALRWEEFFA